MARLAGGSSNCQRPPLHRADDPSGSVVATTGRLPSLRVRVPASPLSELLTLLIRQQNTKLLRPVCVTSAEFFIPLFITLKAAAVGLFPVMLIACSMHAASCSSTAGNETDRLSLLEFKKVISADPQQALASWNDTTHFCYWEGVVCRMKDFRVTSLDLRNRRLVGHISPSLGNLTFLKHLYLADNRFTGQIPPSLVQLPRLQTMILSNNTLNGTIPTFANCSNMKVLWLNGNNLVGKFPGFPLGLQLLYLEFNNLSGIIPSSLTNITTLKAFTCHSNNIEGTIPDGFAKLPELQFLYAGENHLAGKFPQAILNLSTLVELSLFKNQFSGDLPPDLGSSIFNLQLLTIGANFFHGHIPPSLANASDLRILDMSKNNFTGVVPRFFGRLHKLYWLNLQFNKLEARKQQDWKFVDNLGNCTKLEKLSLVGNQLQGHVPISFSNLSVELKELHLSSNQLSGAFPSGIRNFENLNILALYENQFTGSIPEWLGNLRSLQVIGLTNNSFTGFIPTSVSNLSQLLYLYMSSNQLEGNLSVDMGNLQNLRECDVSNNHLHGGIPNGIFQIPEIMIIDLSDNNLHGKLPYDVGNAKHLRDLYLSSNMLSGYIPNTLGNCESLEYIYLQHNRLGGSIPDTLGNIRGLQVLNMSHNSLTGSIPMSLGNLEYLKQLDLSFNNLKGEIPKKGIFSNVTAIRVDGNQGFCGGAMKLHLNACSPIMPLDPSMHKQSVLKKLLISLASMVLLAILTSIVLLWRGKQRRKYVTLSTFGKIYPRVSYIDLARATENFTTSNLIGKGRFSSVYKGILFQERIMVAIKVFSSETRGAKKSFIAECNALRNVRHRNLVPVLTTCSSIDSKGNDFMAVVYKFMPRGDLHELLHSIQNDGDTSTLGRITLAERLRILVDVADALEYLHHNNQGTIVHCDIKPSNILLDESMTAHVGDFGLARFRVDIAASSSTNLISTSIVVKGTIGYVAPECATGGNVSCAGDVYSFGIVLLEIFLRKRPTDDIFTDGLNIVKFVETNFPDKILQIVDPDQILENQHDGFVSQEASISMTERTLSCLLSVLDIGLNCTKSSPRERMDMREIVAKLHKVKDLYLEKN